MRPEEPLADKFASPPQRVQLQRTLPQRSRQHHWQRLRPQRSSQQRRQRTSVRSLLRLVMTLLAGGTENAADAVEEPAASKSAAIPSAIAVFCTTRLSLSGVGDVSTVAHHRAYLSRISIIIVSLATFLSRRNWRPLQAVKC
jgi:hypothetical protein